MKTTETKVILPTISLNGTSPKMLFDGYSASMHAIAAALKAMESIEFHPRDYAQQEDGAANWKAAQEAQRARWAALKGIHDDYLTIAMHCQDRIKQ